MRRKLLLVIVASGLCALALSSCRVRAEFSGGETLSSEETQALLTSLQEKPSEELPQVQEKVYYFVTGSGVVYHSDASCGHLKNSKSVQSGTLAEARGAGKEKLCATCAKRDESVQAESPCDGDRSCYYTPGGTVWHYDRSCSALSHSENVQEGTVNEAMLQGKSRPCARCGE
jgi:hypothetical protein